MKDLAGIYARLNEVYRLYVESAFPLRDPSLSTNRRSLLSRGTLLSQGPLLEPVPTYPRTELDINGVATYLGPDYAGFAHLARPLMGDRQLYVHQLQSLEEVIHKKRDIVVTTGTGSGKTECFLLPLLAELSRESARWPAAGTPPEGRSWWKSANTKFVGQWAHTGRAVAGAHAIRGLILYPLNALVEDQLRRLRSTLENPETYSWMDAERRGNRILFGRYTGLTPVSGSSDDPNARNRLARYLRSMEREFVKACAATGANEIRYHFQNPDGGEMWSRWDMQLMPPDILITNYSMLNIMLMRDIEQGMFERTRNWLASDKQNVFTLIVDELHSYRGTPGTEVAYILRIFLARIGLTPDSEQLRILSTSASIESDSLEFLEQFFGRDRDRFVAIDAANSGGQHTPIQPISEKAPAFESFARTVQPSPIETMQPPRADRIRAAGVELVKSLAGASANDKNVSEELGKVLIQLNVPDAIRQACVTINGALRATRVTDLDGLLFPGADRTELGISDAMRGLLLAVGSATCDEQALLPMRGHLFFHNLQNVWACARQDCSELPTDIGGKNHVLGALYGSHRISCGCGGKVLDLLVCSVCGEALLGGYRSPATINGEIFELLTSDVPDIERLPDTDASGLTHDKYAIFWPSSSSPVPPVGQTSVNYTWAGAQCKWRKVWLDPVTGLICNSPDDGLREGWIYSISEAGRSALPPVCPQCGTDERRASNYPTPIRNHRTGFQRGSQVLAAALLREIELDSDNEASKRKIVLFSDSRQDAAKLSAGMELDHFRDMVRISMLEAHAEFIDDFLRSVSYLLAKFPEALDRLSQTNHALCKLAQQQEGAEGREAFRRIRKASSSISETLSDWIEYGELEGQGAQDMLWIVQHYPNDVPLSVIEDRVFWKLLTMGIIPGGPRPSNSWYEDGASRREWWTCFDWTTSPPTLAAHQTNAQKNHIVRMRESLMREIVVSLFPNVVRTVESLGIGYLTFRPVGSPDQQTIECVDAIIRNMCLKRNFRYWKHFRVVEGDANLWARHVDYVTNCGQEANVVADQINQSGIGIRGTHSEIGIDPSHTWLRIPEWHGDVRGYKCPRCQGFYMHPAGGVCIDCDGVRLVPAEVDASLDYYRYLSEKSGNPFRLHCEELTGQTDVSDKSDRQRWFQDVFLDEEAPRVLGVDLLSVTTTMEAGVDIGSLLAVEMANMPPRRFNYQQRVGRAGRRGAPLSVALTFCRGRSHDDYYYQRPEAITGDPPPKPYIDVRQADIVIRVLIKEVLREAFTVLTPAVRKQIGDLSSHLKAKDSVHGQFGPVAGWQLCRAEVDQFLQGLTDDRLSDLIGTLVVGTSFHRDQDFIDQSGAFLRNDLARNVDNLVAACPTPEAPLSEWLASKGLLPMFGFPTRVRMMYTRLPLSAYPWPPEHGTVDRSLDIAISQFAPGSETIKDKQVHVAHGVVDLFPSGKSVSSRAGFFPSLDKQSRKICVCSACQASIQETDLTDTYTPSTIPPIAVCPVCRQAALRRIDAREPLGFYTNFKPEDFEGVFEYMPSASRPSLFIDAVSMALASGTNSRIAGEKLLVTSTNDYGGRSGFGFRADPAIPGGGAYASVEDPTKATWKVSLLSQRTTDVFLADVAAWPEGTAAPPISVEGRAAWYSFAFLLRLATASALDIDTQEVLAGFRSIAENGDPTGQVFLSDTLDNGAGYSRWLAQPDQYLSVLSDLDPDAVGTRPNFAGFLLSSSHASECDTSCNRCLRDFYNLQYHGLLDWRLGLEMCRIALNARVTIDLTTRWGAYENPWTRFYFGRAPVARAILAQLGYNEINTASGLPAYMNDQVSRAFVAAHPLWSSEHPRLQDAIAEISALHHEWEVQAVNPFRLIRRPTEYL